jgi:hypothetical protein
MGEKDRQKPRSIFSGRVIALQSGKVRYTSGQRETQPLVFTDEVFGVAVRLEIACRNSC